MDEKSFVEALQTTPNIRQALIKLNLSPAGANYSRAKELLNKYQIIQKDIWFNLYANEYWLKVLPELLT